MEISTEVIKSPSALVQSVDDLGRIGKMLSASGYFEDARDVAKASVKVMAGMEMGFGAFASMTGIHIIKGKPAVGANLMAAAVKANPRYDYRVKKMEDDEVSIAFFERIDGKWENLGTSRFSVTDATKAGTQNMGKFPRNMLFARAISNGIKWYCPDVFAGNVTYVPEELGAEVDDDGNVISVEKVEDDQNFIEGEVVSIEKPSVSEAKPEEKPAETEKKTAKKFDEEDFLRKWSKPYYVAGMSRDNAEKMTDSEGKPYDEKTTKELFFMLRAITKKVETLTDDQKEAYQLKVSAICEILQNRKLALTIPSATVN